MKKLNKVKWINCNIYPIYLGFCNSKKAWKRLLKQLGVKTDTDFASCGRCDQFDSSTGGLTIVISLNPKVFKKEPKYVAYSMLAHEAKHAHDAIMDHIKEFKRDGEVSAYTIDWIVREGAKAFKL